MRKIVFFLVASVFLPLSCRTVFRHPDYSFFENSEVVSAKIGKQTGLPGQGQVFPARPVAEEYAIADVEEAGTEDESETLPGLTQENVSDDLVARATDSEPSPEAVGSGDEDLASEASLAVAEAAETGREAAGVGRGVAEAGDGDDVAAGSDLQASEAEVDAGISAEAAVRDAGESAPADAVPDETPETVSEIAGDVAANDVPATAGDAVGETEERLQPEPELPDGKSPRIPKREIAYLFVPTLGADVDAAKVSRSLAEYARLLSVDVIVITGKYSDLIDAAREFGDYKSVMIFRNGAVISDMEVRNRMSSGFVEFDDFAVQVYSAGSSIEEGVFSEAVASKAVMAGDKTFGGIVSSEKPALVFASPGEPSYFDKCIMQTADYSSVSKVPFKFVMSFEEVGFVDLFNQCRYAAPAIGMQHPGLTYVSPTAGERIDFVLSRGMIPEETSRYSIPYLSDLPGIRRYAIFGRAVL